MDSMWNDINDDQITIDFSVEYGIYLDILSVVGKYMLKHMQLKFYEICNLL